MDVSIREARGDDALAVAAASAQLGYEVSTAEVADRLARFRAQDDDLVLVAELDGRVVGWLHVGLRESVGSAPWSEILGFVVEEAARSQGIGRQLLARAVDWSARRKVAKVRVRTRSERPGAHRFYEREGFTFVKAQRVMDLALGRGGEP